jgi:hypothetical protein
MAITVDAGDGRIIEFPDVETANNFFASQGKADEAAPTQAQPERSFGDMLYENIIGSGEVDTPGERLGQLIRGAGAATARGIADVPALPANLLQLAASGYEKLTGAEEPSAVSRALEALPDTREMLAAVPVIGPESQYVAPGTAGEYISTIGEFAGGAGLSAGPKAMIKYGAVPGAASEAAGQATEGTAAEPYARMAGAFFAPMAVSTANKTVNVMFKRAATRPSVETLKDAKNAAYKAVDQSGVKLPASIADDIASKANAAAASRNYVPDVDKQTLASLKVLENQAGKPLSIGELDKIRQGLSKRYSAAPNEVAILDMIDIVDDAIGNAPGGGELMSAARLANSRFKKSELIENAFKKAADQTAAAGTGGNLVNKYRQAVSNIINNPRQAKYFSQEEIDFMRNFVQGKPTENMMRLIGKLSPDSSGLMAFLNLGAVATNPAMIGASMGGALAKRAAEASAMRGAESIKDMLATGQAPQAARTVTDPRMIGILPGLLSQ